MNVDSSALRCLESGSEVSVCGAVDESWACFLRRSVTSEALRTGSLVFWGIMVMVSCGVDEEGGGVKVIGDTIVAVGDLVVGFVKEGCSDLEDRKVRIVLDA
jgi:hypothetical protein